MSTKKKKHKSQPEPLVPLEEALYVMRVAPIHMDRWMREGRVNVLTSHSGPVMRQVDFKKLAHSKEAFDAALEGMATEAVRRQSDDATGESLRFRNEIAQVVQEYRDHIGVIEKIHLKYHDRMNVLTSQTPRTAAYIILSKAITLLRMGCLCIENHYWDTMILLRPIDEALQLAEYFMISADTQEGKKHLAEWFRENKSPSSSVCREAIERHMRTSTPALDDDAVGDALRQLYHAKSKSVHNAFNDIMEVYRTRMDGDKLVGVGFDCGPCSYPRKLFGLLHFFRSSIWTTVQIFLICFHVAGPFLEPEDAKILNDLNLRFNAEIDRGSESL